MNSDTFLLSHTPTTEHRVTLAADQVLLSQANLFTFDARQQEELVSFIAAVKRDKAIRHTYTGDVYILEYEPRRGPLHQFRIIHRSSGRLITMALSTAYKLLDALIGKTERLVKEEA